MKWIFLNCINPISIILAGLIRTMEHLTVLILLATVLHVTMMERSSVRYGFLQIKETGAAGAAVMVERI